MNPTQQNKTPDLQSVISADLFSSQPTVADIKQVLDFMEPHAQPLAEAQIKAIAYLNHIGTRPLHEEYRKANKGKHPYSDFVRWIMESAQAQASPNVFIRVIESLVPKPINMKMEQALNPMPDKRRR